MKPSILFEKQHARLGSLQIRLLQAQDIPVLHRWFNLDYARFWGMQGQSLDQVHRFYQQLQTSGHANAYVGIVKDELSFLMESYAPAHDELGQHYPVQAGDRGMHFFVGPAEKPVHGFTQAVLELILEFLFHEPSIQRIVVEPDVRNQKIHALNRKAGFVYQADIELSNKLASLAFCSRADFATACMHLYHPSNMTQRTSSMDIRIPTLQHPLSHLNSANWAQANRHLVRKILSEFAHEKLLEVLPQKEVNTYRVNISAQEISYVFTAQRYALDHLDIVPQSIRKFQHDTEVALDALTLIIELKDRLGISTQQLPIYLDEISATLNSKAFKQVKQTLSSAELVQASYQQVETGMSEGHPVFIANNGRIGFDSQDFLRYAPESATALELEWIAVAKTHAKFSSVRELDYATLLASELSEATLASFKSRLADADCQIGDYYFMPVHPWQWREKISTCFAADIANAHIVYLGSSEDQYLAQQSIRTFFNISKPQRRYVKTSLSILNMGFMRGLSPYYMSATPQINEWLTELVAADSVFKEKRFTVLREVAAIGYHNRYIEAAVEKDTPYKKMLSALWRESPVTQLRAGQQLMTMASLLHVDNEGHSLAAALVKRSGLDAHEWLQRYLDTYLTPLLHAFFAYDLVFMPHGENLIIVLEDAVPQFVFMKDIAEEIGLLNSDRQLPPGVDRISVKIEDDMKINYIFLDIFDCFFRYLAPLLDRQANLPETQFWQAVASCVTNYQSSHPQFASKYRQFDLFKPDFVRTCLNRLQLNNNQQMIDLDDREKNLKFAGMLDNPLHQFRLSSKA
ncbi:GNAT family N-acetyltransferase [Janthinobacterium sp. LB2P10]|uniref:GNAT family N-acetyltransferase n=1 Tax=Janthinobacterium sp. LB2P10 TaxID=3424194 RepID=UPI003F277CBC|nr:GNAT family N-acetyltransferase [Janthinobacterium lividum]